MTGAWTTDVNYLITMADINSLTLPTALKQIGDKAFEGDSQIQRVIIPSGLTTIRSRAFANCGNLAIVSVPDSVKSIAADAFTNDTNLTLVCASDNTCASFARNYNIPYVIAK